MYLRHTTRRKNGKGYTYWRLVRSVRNGRKVRQETVAYLGELDGEGRAQAKELTRKIVGGEEAGEQQELFGEEAAESISVRLDRVRMERSRRFGDVWLGHKLWGALKFDELLGELLPRGREWVSWADLIEILVIGRLCEPSSELHVAERWYRTTALKDLLGVDEEQIHHVRLYRTLDRLLPHKEAIEKHLVARLGELFEIDYDLLMYDVTSTYFELKKWEREITERGGWVEIREDIEAKICPGSEGTETFLLFRSAARAEKEKAMHRRFCERIEEGLASLQRRITKSKKALDRGVIERQIGRLLQRNSRAAGRYSITVAEDPDHSSGIELGGNTNDAWEQWAELSEGTYILRTNIAEWTHEELWKTYIQLTEAEAAFRIHKSDLSIRPVWHHKADRIKAHIFVCFLAYVLWKTLQKWQSRAGPGDAPRTLFTEFSRIHSADIVLPVADQTDREIRLRCVVRPDPAQAILLDRLGLTLPERISPPRLLGKAEM